MQTLQDSAHDVWCLLPRGGEHSRGVEDDGMQSWTDKDKRKRVTVKFGKLLLSADKKIFRLGWIYKVITTIVIRPLDDLT